MYYVYVFKSEKDGKNYTGFTKNLTRNGFCQIKPRLNFK